MLKENIILEKGIQALTGCLSLIPALRVERVETFSSADEPDYRITIQGKGRTQVIFVEVRTLGTPKNTRQAVNSLILYLRKEPAAYGVVIAPYISSKSANLCREAGIGYLDLSGNCWIAFQQVFINRENIPNQYPLKSGLSTLYSPKSERVLRVLLTFPFRAWKTIELAKEAQVSLGMITHIRKKLEQEEWTTTTAEGLILLQPDELLTNWSQNYSLQQNTLYDFYTLKPISDIEIEIAEACSRANIPYALTGFSASSRLAPMVRGQRAMAYIERDIPLVAKQLGLKPVDSGANVTLIQPYDIGVLWKPKLLNNIQVANPIQVFLDLKRTPGRGEEAADFLYQEVIKTAWLRQKMNTTSAL